MSSWSPSGKKSGAEEGFEDRLRAWPIPAIEKSYTRRDAALYALNVGLGESATDPRALRYLIQESAEPLPTFPSVLAPNSPWLFAPDNGIDSGAILLGELTLRLHGQIPPEATALFEEKIGPVWDRGPDKGAILHLVGELIDKHTGNRIASIERVTHALRNGGFGGAPPPARPSWTAPDRSADRIDYYQTPPDAALRFRFHGDLHPVHWDPAFASRMGHNKPLLHGMCTLGIVGQKLTACIDGAECFRSISIRFKAPVFPCDTLRIESWRKEAELIFRVQTTERATLVADGKIGFAA